jgi:hypothetical protein
VSQGTTAVRILTAQSLMACKAQQHRQNHVKTTSKSTSQQYAVRISTAQSLMACRAQQHTHTSRVRELLLKLD